MRKRSGVLRHHNQLAQNEFGDIKENARRGSNSCARNRAWSGLTLGCSAGSTGQPNMTREDANDTPTAA